MKFHWKFCNLNKIAIDILYKRDKAVFYTFYQKYATDPPFDSDTRQLINKLIEYHHKNKNYLILKCSEIYDSWSELDLLYLTYLENVFEIKINTDFSAFLTYLPLYPRDLQKKQFLIPVNATNKIKISIISHEVNHFYFYEKVNSIIGQKKIERYNKIKIWYLSEIIIPLFFGQTDLQNFMGGLTCSNYLYKIELLDLFKPLFEEWYNKNISFETFFLEFMETKIPIEYINLKYVDY